MSAQRLDVRALARGGDGGSAGSAAVSAVPRPAARWRTRIALPLSVVLAAAGLLAYAGRSALLPAEEVRVAPVVGRPGSAEEAGGGEGVGAVVQAPGWIEPDPYAATVQALEQGVVREVLVLEGEMVGLGQVVARLIDDEAKLELRAAEAAVAQRGSEIVRLEAVAAAQEARSDELRDELQRKRALVEREAISEIEVVQLGFRVRAQEAEASAALAAVEQARGALAGAEAERDRAKLRLDRMEVRSPVAGVVLARLVEPGTRIVIEGSDVSPGVVRLYDPARLQVRVDIPLADAAKVGVEQRAEVTTEALPGRVFEGRVTRLMHSADIQKNTVQAKVSIEHPDARLKPEMLARVRLFGSSDGDGARGGSGGGAGGVRLFVPEAALERGEDAGVRVWVVDRARSSVGARTVMLSGQRAGAWVEVVEGVSIGDRVVIEPRDGLREGRRVRAVESAIPAGGER